MACNSTDFKKTLTPYQLGRYAFLAGEPEQYPYASNPFAEKWCKAESLDEVGKTHDSRVALQWWEGFLDARSDWRLGAVFHQYETPTIHDSVFL